MLVGARLHRVAFNGRGDGRRAEIESDLWEHVADAHASQQHRINTEIDVLARVLIGIPADLTWFRRVRRATKETSSMQHTPASTARAVSPVFAVAIAAALTVLVALDPHSVQRCSY